MKKLVEYIAKSIVASPDEVQVSEFKSDGDNRESVIYELKVGPDDMGVVIGKGGQTIKSIRNIIKIKAIKKGIYADVKIIETD